MISNKDIKDCNYNIFGKWLNNDNLIIKDLPFKHIIIDNFLNDDTYENLYKKFPIKSDKHWWKYDNPLEVKYAFDNIKILDFDIQNIFYALSHNIIINKLRKLFNISNLEYDPYCHGGGLHIYPKNGRLLPHLDYEIHPKTNKQRRLNIILYLNNNWKKEWNGATELFGDINKKIYPKKNSAIIFTTNENSLHGVPDIIKCPNNIDRKSLAFYYVSNIINEKNCNKYGVSTNGYRKKAVFFHNYNKNNKLFTKFNKLIKIRPHRRITNQDINDIWPEWSNTLEY